MATDLGKLADQYKSELLNNVIPFWETHSVDKESSGYFTCLDSKGKGGDVFICPGF